MFIACIILAAGESTRMGSPKSLLEWFDTTLLQFQIRNLKKAQPPVAEIIVVTGHEHCKVAEIANKEGQVKVVHNPDYKHGKTTSLKVGLRALNQSCDAFMVLAVDQPRSSTLLGDLIKAHCEPNKHSITLPHDGTRGGHPVIMDGKFKNEVLNLDDSLLGLRYLIKKHPEDVKHWQTDDATVNIDLNTPTDYKQLKEVYRQYR